MTCPHRRLGHNWPSKTHASSSDGGLLAFEVSQATFVNLGDAGQSADILSILPGQLEQLVDLASLHFRFPAHQFEIHRHGFKPLVDRHELPSSSSYPWRPAAARATSRFEPVPRCVAS